MKLYQSWRSWRARRRLRHHAHQLLKEARRVQRRFGHRLTKAQKGELATRLTALRGAFDGEGELDQAAEAIGKLLDGPLAFTRKSTARQYVESIGGVVFVALLLRSFVVEAYRIPSGSMIPTLEVGDQLWVNKLVYGVRVPFTKIKLGTHYHSPQRGEIIVFEHPDHPEEDLIKRVVGVAGDEIAMHDGVLYINGVATPRQHAGNLHFWDCNEDGDNVWHEGDGDIWRETVGAAHFDAMYMTTTVEPFAREFGPVKVPPDSLFVMGDNRDNSNDSRYWHFVPLNLVRGRAMVVWWSRGLPETKLLGIRFRRLGHLIE
jgi:signal peptidase I